MKLRLIKVEGNYILVSDEAIKEDSKFIDTDTFEVLTCHGFAGGKHLPSAPVSNGKAYPNPDFIRLIIAGIPELPNIDFSLLSDEGCKEIGWVDVEKLADNWFYNEENKNHYENYNEKPAWIKGFKAHQELTKDKLFTIEDMRKAMDLYKNTSIEKEEIIQSLQKTSWDVEVEMEEFVEEETGHELKWMNKRVKVTNNSIKLTKVL